MLVVIHKEFDVVVYFDYDVREEHQQGQPKGYCKISQRGYDAIILFYTLHGSRLLHALDEFFIDLDNRVIKLVAREHAPKSVTNVTFIQLLVSTKYIIFLAIILDLLARVRKSKLMRINLLKRY